MSREEHFLFCKARVESLPQQMNSPAHVSTGAGILIRYDPNSDWSKLKCPFLDYDSWEHDQLLQFVRASFWKENQLEQERKIVAKTP